MTDRSVSYLVLNEDTPKSTQQLKRESSEISILQSAEELFAAQGYHGVSMNQIARHAQVSKGLLYHYFESKEALLKAIFEWAFRSLEQEGSTDGLEGKDLIRGLIDQAFDFLLHYRDLQRLTIGLAVQAHDLGFVHDMATQKMKSYGTMLTKTFTSLDYPNPEGEAYLFGALLDGIALQFMVLDMDYDLNGMKSHLYKKYEL